jgi:plastocyanin
MKKTALIISIFFLASLAMTACGADTGAVALEPNEVVFDVNVIEIKGATDGIEAPSVDPASLSTGYKFKPPGEYDAENSAKWQVSSYMFSPAAFVVGQEDTVTLRTFVLNGDNHVTWLEAPDGSRVPGTDVTMNRGRQYEVSFTADQPGYYTWKCADHSPTMSAQILVLPTEV